MEKNIALIDLDGPLADATARFDYAKDQKAHYQSLLEGVLIPGGQLAYNDDQVRARIGDLVEALYWREVFAQAMVARDQPVAGANERLAALIEAGWEMHVLTSRPEALRLVTLNWLVQHELLSADQDYQLHMKPVAAQYIKTPNWKVTFALGLSHYLQASRVLVVDDSEEVRKSFEHYRRSFDPSLLFIYEALAEAVKEQIVPPNFGSPDWNYTPGEDASGK